MQEPELEIVNQSPPEDMTPTRELEIEPAIAPLRVRFDPPLQYDGVSYPELTLDFEKLTSKDFNKIEREFTRLYKADRGEVVIPDMKHLYHQIIISYLADVPIGLVWKMPRRYYAPLRLEVLKASGGSSEPEAEKESTLRSARSSSESPESPAAISSSGSA